MNLGFVALLGASAVFASAPGVAGEAAARSGDEANIAPFNINNGLQRLNRARKLALRGGGGDGDPVAASAEVLREVKDVAKDHANQLDLLLHQYQDDKEALASSLKSMIGNAQEVASFAKEAREIDPARVDFPLSNGELAELTTFDLDAVHTDALVKMIQPELLEEVAANTRQLVEVLGGLDLEVLSTGGRRRLFEEGHDAFGFGFDSDEDSASSPFDFVDGHGPNPFHPRGFTNPLVKIMKRGMSGNHRMKLPKNLRSETDGKERHHRRLQENAVCLPRCDPKNSMYWKCSCKDLIDYATNITAYDLAVMYAQQYIETDENSDSYGNFTVNVTTLDLFDADDDLPAKADRISSMASEMSSGDLSSGDFSGSTCEALLKEFHTAVSLDGSRQLTVEEVGLAVHTDTKLNLVEIVEKYDGLDQAESPFLEGGQVDQDGWQLYFDTKVCIYPGDCTGFPDEAFQYCTVHDLVTPYLGLEEEQYFRAKRCRWWWDELLKDYESDWSQQVKPSPSTSPVQCNSVSYTSCAEFADSFDLLYQSRDTALYPKTNPMRKDQSQAVYPSTGDLALDMIQFPVAYTYTPDEHGIKTLSGYENANLRFAFDTGTFRDAWFAYGQDNYTVACSNPNDCGTTARQAPSTSKYNVKCCSNTTAGSDFWRSSPFGESWTYPPEFTAYDSYSCQYTLVMEVSANSPYGTTGTGVCPPPMTHAEGAKFCAGYGGRLCTSDELVNGCAQAVGCGFDPDMIWASEYSFQYSAETGCRRSQVDGSYAKAMEACDQSVSFLVGQQTSIGSVASLARLVDEKGPGRMPGKCCLDDPFYFSLFGEAFNPETSCLNRGDWHLGISEDICEAAGGMWTRSPCVTLQECIANRPTNTSAGYSASFESFASQIDVDDASDEDECRNARQRLGFDQDYDFDADVCDAFNSRMCDPFYDDLDEATAHPEPTWKDIKYTPVQYPDDPDLPFNNLTEMKTYTAAADDPTLPAMKILQIGQQVSWTSYQTSAYISRKTKQLTDFACEKLPPTLTAFGFTVSSNPLYLICRFIQLVLLNVVWVLEFLELLAWDGMSNALVAFTQQQTNWAKETYTFLTQHVFGDGDATSDPWLPKTLDTLNDNMYNQHTAVRDELQKRHEEMVNDVNQETVDTANCLGCQLVIDMGGNCDISKECPEAGRRLEDKFRVTWPAADDFDGGDDLWEVMKTIHNRIQQNEKVLTTMHAGMARIHEALDIDDVSGPTPTPTPAPTKRSKKAKQAKFNGSYSTANLFQTQNETAGGAVEDGSGSTNLTQNETVGGGSVEDGSGRNLMHVSETYKIHEKMETLEAKIDALERQVKEKMDSIEQKIEGAADESDQMKAKIDAIEGKLDALDKIERKMDALVDLVMQLTEAKQS